MKAYKILDRTNRQLHSCIVTGDARTRYFVGKPTTPKVEGSYLMAFASIEDAKNFGFDPQNESLYEVEAKLAPTNRWRSDLVYAHKGDSLSLEELKRFWLVGNYGLAREAPLGTLFCEEITLTKRIS
jgi:hypothetical protein